MSAKRNSEMNFGEIDRLGKGAAYIAALFYDEAYHGKDLRDLKLNNTYFRGCVFTDVDFSGADLEAVEFENCILEGCTFDGAALDSFHLYGGGVKDCSFRGATFVFSSFSKSFNQDDDLTLAGEIDFSGADMRGLEFFGVEEEDCRLVVEGAKVRKGSNLLAHNSGRDVGTPFVD